MADLFQAINRIYGTNILSLPNQTNVQHMFSLYVSPLQPQQRYFLKLLQLPKFLYISQATLQQKISDYGTLLPKYQFMPLQRKFQTHSYIVQSPYNIIPLTSFLRIKMDCGQPLEIEFFLKCLQFLTLAFQRLQTKGLPIFKLTQVGVTEKADFILADPSLYFSGHQRSSNHQKFGSWINQMVREILQLPPEAQKEEQMLKLKLGDGLHILKPLLQYLKSGDADVQTLKIQMQAISRFAEEITTQSGSLVDIHELAQRAEKEDVIQRRVSFQKLGKLGKTIALLVVVSTMVGIGYFCFEFLTRSILCPEGEYLDGSRQCLSCFSGCIRCSDSQPNSCQRCSLNMYLILDDQQDKQGFCLNQCRGKLINVGVCVLSKQPATQQPVTLETDAVFTTLKRDTDY